MAQKTRTINKKHTRQITLVRPLNANARSINLGILEKCATFYNYIFEKGNSEEKNYSENGERTYTLPDGVKLGEGAIKTLQNNGYMPRPNGSKGYEVVGLTIDPHMNTPLPPQRYRQLLPIEDFSDKKRLFEETLPMAVVAHSTRENSEREE